MLVTGVAREPQAALPWLEAAAASRQLGAGYDLGVALLSIGDGRDAGLAWIRRSAETGNWRTIVDLGRFHEQGRHGLARDAATARTTC